MSALRFAYADPPYIGCAQLYVIGRVASEARLAL